MDGAHAMTTNDPFVDVDDDDGNRPLVYPQPSLSAGVASEGEGPTKPYRYVRYENAEGTFFPGTNRATSGDDLPPDTLVWVLLSKGKRKVPKLHKRARVCDGVADGDGRILVRYPDRSTYRVRRKHLVPVMEYQTREILVASETNDYRRMSIVHTRREDHFIEIGCDFGILVDRVDAKSSLGIDKSEESIRIARERYPDQKFLLRDVFEEDNDDLLQALRQDDADDLDHGEDDLVHNLVVSIDINGNRELPAVLRCIQLVLDSWSPRLLMVKSRALHASMVAGEGDESNDNENDNDNDNNSRSVDIETKTTT